MKFVLQMILLATDCGIALMFLYWAALEVGYGLGLSAPAAPTHIWLFFAFGNSVAHWARIVRRDAARAGLLPPLREGAA